MPFTACLAMMMCVIIQQHQIGPLALAVTPTQFRIPLHVVLKTNLKLMQKQTGWLGAVVRIGLMSCSQDLKSDTGAPSHTHGIASFC